MSLFARDLAKAGVEREHPDWDDARVTRELLRLAFLPEPLPAKFLARESLARFQTDRA
jgi:hypothetical protein